MKHNKKEEKRSNVSPPSEKGLKDCQKYHWNGFLKRKEETVIKRRKLRGKQEMKFNNMNEWIDMEIQERKISQENEKSQFWRRNMKQYQNKLIGDHSKLKEERWTVNYMKKRFIKNNKMRKIKFGTNLGKEERMKIVKYQWNSYHKNKGRNHGLGIEGKRVAKKRR